MQKKAELHAQITEELETEGLSRDACRQRDMDLKRIKTHYEDINMENNVSDQVDSVRASEKQKKTDNTATKKSKLWSVM